MSKWVNLPRPGKPTARGVVLDLGLRRPYTSGIIIRCASYPEWLRDGPCDATATGSPTRRMLVLTPAQRLHASFSREGADGTDKMAGGRGEPSLRCPLDLPYPLPLPSFLQRVVPALP